MKTIAIHASKKYNVKIGDGLLEQLGSEIKGLGIWGTAAIVSDSTVWPFYGAAAVNALSAVGMKSVSFVVPSGEASKNSDNYIKLLNFLANNKLSRSDVIIALGGGVVGDLAGFAAATYLRGIAFIQVPTTLLAAVDSSVGGKTAIDLPSGKNLAGAFYQPDLVICDLNTLHTLPVDIFTDGCAEVIKYAILYDPVLFEQLSSNSISFDREDVIARCVELKRDAVVQDEFDTGLRMKLNLGHTIGHSIEVCSNFSISHGKAVAIGTAIITRASAAMHICSQNTADQIVHIFKRFHLPVKTGFQSSVLADRTLSDKKRTGDKISLILPTAIGNCIIQPTEAITIKSIIEAGM